ncbi:hypothetical protein [uncultured Fibrobacter sp.]|jgi:hypothetical protein|uniref:hypothetical protein n=1 Tax=uncultured Fibrobacter sp. TaxID=261512 RepID=UPI0026191378|nr:hypothetical protein [uncultured Fibrobacter sp.]
MKKFMYMALSAFALLACSEDAQNVGGTSEDPNTLINNGSILEGRPRLCRTSQMADASVDCDWSAEMWNPESGNRVHTGFDNGTNTSGIWFWRIDPTEKFHPSIQWPAEVSEAYDSLSLSNVISSCGGSVCGHIVVDVDTAYYPWGFPFVEIEFSMAGKNSSGEFDAVDASDLKGLCVGYATNGLIKMTLDFGDTINGLFTNGSYGVELDYDFMHEDRPEDDRYLEQCFAWSDFKVVSHDPFSDYPGYPPISLEQALKHLEGIRFRYDVADDATVMFNIVRLGRYTGRDRKKANEEKLPVVGDDCDSPERIEDFCLCNYSDSLAVRTGKELGYQRGLEEVEKILADSVSESFKKEILYELDLFRWMEILNDKGREQTLQPCDNPEPKILRCSDGSLRFSQQYSDVKNRYDEIAEEVAPQKVQEMIDFVKDALIPDVSPVDSAYELYMDYGELWNYGRDDFVKTNLYADSTWPENLVRGGEWFYESDSAIGGNTLVNWGAISDSVWSIAATRDYNSELYAYIQFNGGQPDIDSYANIGFYVAGFDSNGVAQSADISNWDGICVAYLVTSDIKLAIDLGDSVNRDLGYDLPVVKLTPALDFIDLYTKRCFAWSDFKQEGWGKDRENFKYTITGEEAAQKAVKMVFQIRPEDGWDPIEVAFMGISTNHE